MNPHSLRTIAGLRPGDHLCCIYEMEEEHRAVLMPFLRQGMERGDGLDVDSVCPAAISYPLPRRRLHTGRRL